MTAVTLRAATAADGDAIAALWCAGWRDGHIGHVPAALCQHRRLSDFRQLVLARLSMTTAATLESRVIGFVTQRDDEVEQLYVAGAARGSGVADALLEHAEQLIAARFDVAWLAVVAGNARARRFYARRGWSDVGAIDYAAQIDGGTFSVPARRYEKRLSMKPFESRRRNCMTNVVADMSMSLDGFVADVSDGVGAVFAWYGKPQPAVTPPVQPASDPEAASLGVIVYGRRTFDIAGGWGGNHPVGVPVIVVTHWVPPGWPRPDSTVSFVTDGVERAIERAKEVAGDKSIAIGSPSIAQQCLELGRLDRLQVKLVPVLLGSGIRFFDNLASAPIELDGPTVTEGNGVTHLHYSVHRADQTEGTRS